MTSGYDNTFVLKVKLIGRDKFNHLIYTLTSPNLVSIVHTHQIFQQFGELDA
jgi:hypothetical protein